MDALSILALGVAQAGGGGGGTSYTAGDGIDITNNEISVDLERGGGLDFNQDGELNVNWSQADISLEQEHQSQESYSTYNFDTDGFRGEGYEYDIDMGDYLPATTVKMDGGSVDVRVRHVMDDYNDKITITGTGIEFTNENENKTLAMNYDGELEWDGISLALSTDIPAAELPTISSGDAGKVLTVNSGETGVEWAAGGGGGSSGAVRYDEAQSLTDAQFNQVMSNLQLGASKGTVQDWRYKSIDNYSSTFSDSTHEASSTADPSVTQVTVNTGDQCEITLCINNDEQTKVATATSNNSFNNLNWLVGGVTVTFIGKNGPFRVLTSDATSSDSLSKLEIKTVTHEAVISKIDSDLLPTQALEITNTTGIKTNIGTSQVSSAAADSIAIGNGAQANSQHGIAIGSNSSAGQYSIVIGDAINNSNSSQSAYIGNDIRSSSNNNYVFGARGFISTTWGQGNLVLANKTANYPYWYVYGPYNYTVVARDYKTYPDESANYIIEGYNSKVISSGGTTVSSFKGTVIGDKLINSGQYTTVIGKNNADKYITKVSLGNNEYEPIYSTTNAPKWNSSTTYAVGDVVNYQGYLFSCKQANTNHAPNYQNTSGNDYWGTFGEGVEGYAFVIGNGADNDNRSNALTVDWSGNLVCNNIPACPSTDGTYNLQVSIVNGVPTYSWVAV